MLMLATALLLPRYCCRLCHQPVAAAVDRMLTAAVMQGQHQVQVAPALTLHVSCCCGSWRQLAVQLHLGLWLSLTLGLLTALLSAAL